MSAIDICTVSYNALNVSNVTHVASTDVDLNRYSVEDKSCVAMLCIRHDLSLACMRALMAWSTTPDGRRFVGASL